MNSIARLARAPAAVADWRRGEWYAAKNGLIMFGDALHMTGPGRDGRGCLGQDRDGGPESEENEERGLDSHGNEWR